MPGPRSQWQVQVLHLFNPSAGNDKYYAVRIDVVSNSAQPYKVVAAGAGRGRTAVEWAKGTYALLEDAKMKMKDVLRSKTREGYEDIESSSYRHGLTLEEAMTYFDSTRILGYSASDASKASSYVQPNAPVTVKENKSSRANRSISL